MEGNPAVSGGLCLNQARDHICDTLQRVASQVREVRFQQGLERGTVRGSGIWCHGDPSMPLFALPERPTLAFDSGKRGMLSGTNFALSC
jgi:hypothetical protein